MSYCKPEWTPVTTELNGIRWKPRTKTYLADDGTVFVLGPGHPASDEIYARIDGEYVHLTAVREPLDVRKAEYDDV